MLYLKLAVQGIKRNSQAYLPYLGACLTMVMMFYLILFLAVNPGLDPMTGGRTIQLLLNLGCIVVAFFAVIFLFYTHNFLIRQRKKELGLYHILGMEKHHLARILTWETVLTAGLSVALGLAAGVLLSKLMLLLLLKLLGVPAPIGFVVPGYAVATTLKLFGGIFLAIYLNTLRQVYRLLPIELLRASQVGEREPKSRWLLAVLGGISLGIGYYMALTIVHPLDALVYFFIAVIFVMIGTYLLFVAGSIAFLKLLRANRRVYYRPKWFVIIAGMIYRMKQHGAGLANICILSSMVLVTLSTTVSLYVGSEDALQVGYPREVMIRAASHLETDVQWVQVQTREILDRHQVKGSNWVEYRMISFPVARDGHRFWPRPDAGPSYSADTLTLNFITLEDYNRLVEEPVVLADQEVLVYSNRSAYTYSSLHLFDREFVVKERLDQLPGGGLSSTQVFAAYYVVVKDRQVLEEIRQQALAEQAKAVTAQYLLGFDLDASREQALAVFRDLRGVLEQNKVLFVRAQSREADREEFYFLYGGLFFLGLYLGLLFILGTVLIMYYKQITEGYEDRRRYRIMQQVGMSRQEVQQTIGTQVLAVFFLPLVAAGVHVAFAFKMVTKLLTVLNLTNVPLFALCTVLTFLAFALFYTLVYLATARVYYRLVAGRANGLILERAL
ncbi:MAG: FtsX-like permease family protein [Limnochordia bacterium]